ncbi:expressed unknown protein [Seminavis robusta]|uniref:Alpha/beta hydrolase fold-5 domain-containing protein n=1 Tax=Seminavis robusta TaxID=568900 RepID=A0A9N8ED46_9STRA|nr:expressed unknown protein [Seminavis robusta]|eukprot:Sro1002_g229850.1 n/a (553) ;mRNA; f:14427-16085
MSNPLLDSILGSHQSQNLILSPPSQSKAKHSIFNKKENEPIAIILLPGCQLKPEQYRGVAEAVQQASNQEIWVAVTKFPLNVANPLVAPEAVKEAFQQLKDQGYSGDKVFLGGHSLGGVVLPWVMDGDKGLRQDQVAGVIQLGSFLARDTQENAPIRKVPSLTLTGDLDGMVRTSRIAEDYHRHVIADAPEDKEASNDDDTRKLHHSVVLVEGMNHFGFVGGETPIMKRFRDLPQEIDHRDAVREVAETIADFIDVHQTGDPISKNKLLGRIDETTEYLKPLLTALQLEGSTHVGSDPTKGSPFVNKMQKELLSEHALPKVTVSNEFRASWYLNPFAKVPFFHPKVHSSKDYGSLEMETYADPVHEKTDACFDAGFFSNTVHELRCKFNSPQAVLQAATGDDRVKFDPCHNFAKDLNEKTLAWAMENAPTRVKRRYQQRGVQLVPGDDINHSSGPSWIWSYMNYENDPQDPNCRVVRSHTMATPTDHPIPAAGGKLYCKLLSPAKALDWMYTDSLRLKINPVEELVQSVLPKLRALGSRTAQASGQAQEAQP